MKKIFTSSLLLVLFLSVKSFAQISGVIYVPGPGFTTLKQVIDSLNGYGVGAVSVTVRVTANQTAPSGGYVLGSSKLNSMLSASKTLTFVGSNASTTVVPRTIFAQSGAGSNDAIFTLQGTSYVTFRSINLEEVATNTTATTMMERGYSIVKFNKDTGTKKTSIVDCNITLNNTNTTAASGIAPLGATGVFIGNCTYLSNTALALAVGEAGTNDGTFISGCAIRNTNNGIYHAGISVVGDGTSYNDKNLTIVGDTIENFTHNGISISYSNSDLVSGNVINNTAAGGIAPTSNNLFGIRYANNYPTSLATNSSWDCYNNKINLTINSAGTYALTGIYTQVNGTGNTTIEGDTIQLTSSGTSAQLNGIFSQNQLGNQRIANNLIANFSTQTTNVQPVYGIAGGYNTSVLGLVLRVYPSSSTITGNVMDNWNVCSGTGAQVVGCVDENLSDAVSPLTSTFTNNTLSNITLNNNCQQVMGYGGLFRSTPANIRTTTITGNTFTRISTTGATNTTPIILINPGGPYPGSHTIAASKNKMNNINTSLGWIVGYHAIDGKSIDIDSDTLTDLTSASWHVFGVASALSSTATSTGTISVSNSSYTNFKSNSTAGGAAVSAFLFQQTTSTQTTAFNVKNNLIRNLTSLDTSGLAFGISTSGGGSATYTITNNMISDIAASADTSVFNSSVGINLTSSGTNNVWYNTVKMVSSSTTAKGYGASGLRFNPAGTNTIQNNILHVNVLAGSLNNVSAIRAASGSPSAAPAVSAFTASSNIYHSPTGPNNYLFVCGLANSTLVNGYHQSGLTSNNTKNIVNDTFFNSECNTSSYHKFMQTGASTRERKTFTENNLTGTGGIYAPSGMSYAESAATDVAVSVDFKLDPRPFTTSDIGALEFAGTTRPQMLITVVSSTGFDTACTFKLPTLSSTIPSFFTRVSYQWYRDTTKIVGATMSSTVVLPISGNYIVKVYDSTTGCLYASNPFKMTIVPPPPAQITYYDSLTFCESSAIVLQANKGYNYIYRWFRNGTPIAGETNDHLVVSKTGNYTLEVNTPLGCETVSTPIRVKVYPLPTPTITWNSSNVLGTQKYYLYQWYKNNIKIDSFAQNRTFSTLYTGDGAYSVEVTDSNGCTAKSNIFLYSTGIDESVISANIKIFPNPASDRLIIESPILLNARMTDLAGRVVLKHDDAQILNTSALANGLYILSLSDKDEKLIRVEKINIIK
jgi:hypothetical protein